MKPLRPREIFAVLQTHDVNYVVIGGLAAVLHGSPLPTLDVDICPAPDAPNLERLAAALCQLDARVRAPDAPDGLPFDCNPAFFVGLVVLNLTTRWGDLDLSFAPAGTDGYADLKVGALMVSIGPLQVPVAALEDVIRSKEAANRPKDHRTLPVLKQLLEKIRSGSP